MQRQHQPLVGARHRRTRLILTDRVGKRVLVGHVLILSTPRRALGIRVLSHPGVSMVAIEEQVSVRPRQWYCPGSRRDLLKSHSARSSAVTVVSCSKPCRGSGSAARRHSLMRPQQRAARASRPQHHPAQQPPTSQRQPARALAVLIDADNAPVTQLGPVLAEAAKYGIVTMRRIYGDWTSPQISIAGSLPTAGSRRQPPERT